MEQATETQLRLFDSEKHQQRQQQHPNTKNIIYALILGIYIHMPLQSFITNRIVSVPLYTLVYA